MNLESKNYFHNIVNKKIYIMENPKKLLNRYFFSGRMYINIKLSRELLKGITIFFFKMIFKRIDLRLIFKKLPNGNSLKQKLINFYSLLLVSSDISKYSNSILIIGDYQNALNMSVLQLSYFDETIEFWIINQGSGSIEKKISFKYPEAVKKVFFPYSSEASYENNLLLKAESKKKGINFYNIDTTLNLKLSCNINNLAIFQGYNKNYRLYPFYILILIKEIFLISFIKDLNKFDSVDIFLHPRLGFLCLLDFLNLKKSIYFRIFDPKIEYKYKYIISYSPTINSSLIKAIRYSENYLYEIGSNFNKTNTQKCLKIFNL